MPSTIFVIDSSPAVRRMVEQISTPEGFEVVGFQDGPTALEAARKRSPHLIIVDYHLDNMTFSGFCKEVQRIDNLADTYIVSLISPSDRLDEKHLRSLGVKAFLKKPFQSDNLLEVIKDLGSNGSKKRRSWPPASSSTDSDEDPSLVDQEDETELSEEDTGQIAAAQIPPPKILKKSPPPPPSKPAGSTAPKATGEPEDAMKGLFGQLLETMTERTEEKISTMLPHVIGKELASQVAKAVQDEVQTQLGATLSQERLAHMIEPLLGKELSNVLSREMPVLEPIIRHSIFEIATPLVKDSIDGLAREQAETVKKTLPDVVHDQIGSIDVLVRDEIQQAAVKQATQIADEIVRAAVKEQVEQAVQRLVPGIAEEQIKAELKRLTALE
ncbi:MAG TPA: response regulator [Nitrospiraceae bacterium]|nr:response regulator [Nitrospiraceae bacterium]